MIIVLSKDISAHDKNVVVNYVEKHGFKAREQRFGSTETSPRLIMAMGKGEGGADVAREAGLLPGVERVTDTSKPYVLASRETKPEDTIVKLGKNGEVSFGGRRISVIAGPCAVESQAQIDETAARVRESGAVVLRGGAFKPRTSPYSFQGLGMKGLEMLREAGDKYNMPIVTEVVSPEWVLEMLPLVDMFQIGARNMQNFELLKKVGATGKPVLLKRGIAATMEEWLMAAEYLLAGGTRDVVLCERGIRTFETYTRNTLDISAISVVKGLTHLPVIVDPSHALGIRAKVPSAALAAIAAGADWLTVEVHPRPDEALSDGPQSLYPEQFERLMRDVEALAPVVGKEVLRVPQSVETEHAQSLQTERPLRSADSQPTIAYSGRAGAYAERALINKFGEDAARLACAGFPEVFNAVLDGRAAYGMMPIENTLTGSIHENYDLFLRYPDVVIAGECKLRVMHCLVACPSATLDSITTVRSHPQGFAQCRTFLAKQNNWLEVTYPTTADAVHSLSLLKGDERAHTAAIASEDAARADALTVLKAGIEDNAQNYTRFAIIARKGNGEIDEKADKASLVFSVNNEPGALYKCLKLLSDRGIDLSKLESRPILGQPWRYMFYLDVSIPGDRRLFSEALKELEKQAADYYFLGSYRAA
jgi:3-deoxy-7-phosphoheptulonate synthase